MKRIHIISLLVALTLLATSVAFAAGGPTLRRQVVSGGGRRSTDGDIVLNATLGQPLVGLVSGGDVTLGQGFWHGGAVEYRIYLPVVLRDF
jgi:hypothetical protein